MHYAPQVKVFNSRDQFVRTVRADIAERLCRQQRATPRGHNRHRITALTLTYSADDRPTTAGSTAGLTGTRYTCTEAVTGKRPCRVCDGTIPTCEHCHGTGQADTVVGHIIQFRRSAVPSELTAELRKQDPIWPLFHEALIECIRKP